ncbi:MAG TPA: sigma-54 dependent transcriptional regulator [Thermoanaerobaculia bacterium]|nr:sigma-54 dependent transcriptional regulator [Thermoanaerobaculia bacterium]
MANRKSIQVVLAEGDRPVRMLLEREIGAGGRLAVRIEEGESAGHRLPGEALDVMARDLELEGESAESPIRVLHSSSASGERVVISPGGPLAGEHLPQALEEAFGFLTRPVPRERLPRESTTVPCASEVVRPLEGIPAASEIIGTSPRLVELLSRVERVAASQTSVFIQGETGTGKSLVAKAIHQASRRARKPFVVVNCSAFQDQLLESELFGHEKGSFTGAVNAKPGLFEIAHEGTLFLDEVAEMSTAMQAKLLQVLDDGHMRRIGSTKSRNVDVRVISASNKDLTAEVKAGRFREDLLYRLKVITLSVPSLRQRKEDIPSLVEHLLRRLSHGSQPRRIHPAALALLCEYSWPGNVRELANVLEGLVLMVPGEEIGVQDLPPALRPSRDFALVSAEAPLPLDEIERLHIQRALRYTEGKKAPAARLLGIDIKTLNSKIQGYGIEL